MDDADNDGVPDVTDNCPRGTAAFYPSQAGGDGNGVGTACDHGEWPDIALWNTRDLRPSASGRTTRIPVVCTTCDRRAVREAPVRISVGTSFESAVLKVDSESMTIDCATPGTTHASALLPPPDLFPPPNGPVLPSSRTFFLEVVARSGMDQEARLSAPLGPLGGVCDTDGGPGLDGRSPRDGGTLPDASLDASLTPDAGAPTFDASGPDASCVPQGGTTGLRGGARGRAFKVTTAGRPRGRPPMGQGDLPGPFGRDDQRPVHEHAPVRRLRGRAHLQEV